MGAKEIREKWQKELVESKRPRKRQPSVKTMEKWAMDGVAQATDGCRVEPDGVCQHGCKSWLLELGII